MSNEWNNFGCSDAAQVGFVSLSGGAAHTHHAIGKRLLEPHDCVFRKFRNQKVLLKKYALLGVSTTGNLAEN